jgi:hypothetical protein
MAKYITRINRYINGEYIQASVEEPQVVDIPDGCKPDPGLEPYTEGPIPSVELKPHYAPKVHHSQTADERARGVKQQQQGPPPKRAVDRDVA